MVPNPGQVSSSATASAAHVEAGEHGVDDPDPVHVTHPTGDPCAQVRFDRSPERAGQAGSTVPRGSARLEAMSVRPERIVLVCGTGTEVGKTWVAARLLGELRSRGITVAARKPAQSFDVDGVGTPLGGPTDAEVLGSASGEHPDRVCHAFRSYHRAMSPPMAAEALGLAPFTVDDLVSELDWPDHPVGVGLVEMAGGVRSPQAVDGDATDVAARLRPDLVVLVADAGLGTINTVRLSMDALDRGRRWRTVRPGGRARPVRQPSRDPLSQPPVARRARRLPGDHPAGGGARPRRSGGQSPAGRLTKRRAAGE